MSAVVIADTATGAELVAALEAEAARRGVTPDGLARLLSPHPHTWLMQVRIASRPKLHTIERVRALLAGEPVPPVPPNNFQKRSYARQPATVAIGMQRAIDRPVPETDPVDRDPCWRCGVRGDVGCVHRLEPWARGSLREGVA